MKGQISTELMVIIAAILVIFIPLLFTIYLKSTESYEQLYQVQAELVSTRLAYLINSVGNLGTDSSVVAEIFIPPRVKKVEVRNLGGGGEVIVQASTRSGDTDIVDTVRFPLEESVILDTPSPGLRRFNITYDGLLIHVKLE